MTIWTIGHSSRTLDEFLALLSQHEIQAIADVRRFPGSRRQPWFARDLFADNLTGLGLTYRWIPALGGRRRPKPESVNTAWRNSSFRGYADHLESAEFAGGLDELLDLAAGLRTSMMCAEVLWWRCHRALISDVLTVRGVKVVHIMDANHTQPHRLSSAARIVEGRLSYTLPDATAG